MPVLVAALPYIVVAATVASTAVSVTAAVEGGQQQKKSADYQAKEMQQQALEAKQTAAIHMAQQQERAATILSSIRATAAASGLDIASGSPLEVYSTSSEQAQINDMYTKYAGNLQASGLQAQASLLTWGGKNAATAGYLTGAGELIGGLGSLANFGLSYSTKTGSNTPAIS